MVELCADMKSGEVAVFDKAYVVYEHLHTLTEREIFWVTRAKENARFTVIAGICRGSQQNIISDEVVKLTGKKSASRYPETMRRICARVRDSAGVEKTITSLGNNFEWAASSICDLYRSRWAIETFFKEIKHPLQLRTFIGFSRNAIEWQLWSAMLAYLLLRLTAWLGKWQGDFKHYFTLVKGIIWNRQALIKLILSYGTAQGRLRIDLCPTMPFLKGIDWETIN